MSERNGHTQESWQCDEQAERFVLGAMLSGNAEIAAIGAEQLKPTDFYNPLRRKIFDRIQTIAQARKPFDEYTVSGDFNDAERDAIGRMVLDCPHPSHVEEYARLVKDTAFNREADRRADELRDAAKQGRGREVLGVGNQSPQSEALRPSALLSYNTEQDPNCLAGVNRWANKSGSIVLTGPAGVGKSALRTHFELCAALCEPFFGIPFTRPLLVLSVQGENDIGDCSEALRGAVNGLGYTDRAAELEENLFFITESARTGADFARLIDVLATKYKPDMVTIDPYLCYLGGDINSQEANSKFLRNLLTPIAQRHGFFYFIVHHVGKPKSAESKKGMVASDHSYAGIGSSEITNWARGTLNLSELQGGVFELRAAKRGRRAGLVDADGNPATVIHLQHSRAGICWERADSPDAPANEVLNARLEEIKNRLLNGSHRYTDIEKVTHEVLGCKARSTATKFMGDHVFRILKKTPGTSLYVVK